MPRRHYHAAMEPRDRAASDASIEPATRVLRQFRQVFNAVKTHFQQVEKQAGVGGAQVWALSVIRDRPGIVVGELARALDIHPSTASNLVRSLVERELVEGVKDGIDRRALRLRLRPAGQRVLRRSPGPFSGVLPQALARLDAATLERMSADLGGLIRLLEAGEEGAQTPLAEL